MRINKVNKRVIRIVLMSVVCVLTFVVGTIVSNASAYPGVEYRACTENTGWYNWVRNKVTAGDATKSEKLQVVKMILTDTNNGGIRYSTYALGQGWQEKVTNGDASGSTNGIQAIKVELFGDIKSSYSVKYRGHILGKDWTEWAKDGAEVGVTSGNDVLDAYEVVLVTAEGTEVIADAADYSKDLPAIENIQASESKSTEVVYETENKTGASEGAEQTTNTNDTITVVDETTPVASEPTNTTAASDDGITVENTTTTQTTPEQTTTTPTTTTTQPASNELAQKLVNKALDEVGQGPDASGNTKYGQWWANKVGDNAFASAKWSSMFLAWCGDQIGLSDEQYGYYACSDYWVTWFKNNNAYHEVKDYTPLVGDMIFFDYDKNGVSDHNGVVKSASNGKVYAIEGNVDGKVSECNYDLTDENIKGYGTPLFDKVSTTPNNSSSNNGSSGNTEVATGGSGATFGNYAKLSTPITGIDVSTFNGSINWSKVKTSEAKFAYIRLGGRDTGGSLYTDSKYFTNIKGATDAGIDVGVYFFTQAVSTDEAIAEANYVLEKVKGYNLKYPIAIDTEYSPSGKRTNSLSKANRTAIMKAFCDKVASAGYKTQIYSSKSWFTEKLNVADLNSYDKWVAHYTSAGSTNFAYPYSVWQYTDKGSISGISGNVDLNKCYVQY